MPDESRRAEEAFGSARRRAWWRDVMARLAGRPNTLLSYQQVKNALRLGGPIYRGVQPVPVAQIIGSVDRYRDFDEVFLPAQDRTAQRWKSIARAYYEDVDLPPVRLYKVGDAYFVLDGHHRVSVAREQGMDFIDAEVQEVVSRVPLSADLKAEDVRVLHEYRRFLDRTRLDQVRPDQRIRFTVAGGFDRLLEHIATHRIFMQLEQQRAVSEEEAVLHWYDTVYKPLVEVIREHGVLKEFPNRTESDLYLWITEHYYYLREKLADVSIEQAAEDYADQYSEKPIKRLVRAMAQVLADGDAPDHEAIKTQQAHDRFLARTRLAELRPEQAIRCSSDLGYAKLQEHIERHRYYMGLDFKRAVSEDEAVMHWYDSVYLPIVTAIRDNHLLDEFTDQTETDLYLSIIDYLDELRKDDQTMTPDKAALTYAQQFEGHPIRSIVGGLRVLFGAKPADAASTADKPPAGDKR